jgi:hypothetical protein
MQNDRSSSFNVERLTKSLMSVEQSEFVEAEWAHISDKLDNKKHDAYEYELTFATKHDGSS